MLELKRSEPLLQNVPQSRLQMAMSATHVSRVVTGYLTVKYICSRKLNIQILKQTVEAKTRKLSARWTFEAAQDAQSQHGIDVEAEIMAALAQEITAEIDQEILASLRALATTAETYDQTAVSSNLLHHCV